MTYQTLKYVPYNLPWQAVLKEPPADLLTAAVEAVLVVADWAQQAVRGAGVAAAAADWGEPVAAATSEASPWLPSINWAGWTGRASPQLRVGWFAECWMEDLGYEEGNKTQTKGGIWEMQKVN